MNRNNRGQVLVFVALAIFVILGLAALGIDVGYMYSVRHELQRCADAGALAGASAFRQYGKDSNDTSIVDGTMTTKNVAEARAIDFATRDKVSTSRLNTVAGDVVSVSFPTTPNLLRVRVDVQRTAPLFFARVLGWNNVAIPAFAVAEAFAVTKRVKCVVPWGIPMPWADDGDGIYNGETVHDPDDPSYSCDQVTSPTTNWDTSTHTILGARSDRDQYLCPGSLQVLKIGEPGKQQNPGNFLGLDLSAKGCGGNPGADFYYWMITHSCQCGIEVGVDDELSVDTKTGNMVQRTITAVAPSSYYEDPDGRPPYNSYLPNGWKNDPDSLMNQDPAATWVTSTGLPGGAPSGGTGTESPRIVKVPIYDPRATMDSSGKFTFKVKGFAGFWIQDVVYKNENNNDLGTVVGRFVSIDGDGTDNSDESGYTVLNIRLVE